MNRLYVITAFSLLFLCSMVNAQQVVYVSGIASGLENGTSWNDAFRNLPDAINAAPDGAEIWVSVDGTFYVTKTQNPDDKIFINKNLRIIGGFAGNETTNIPTAGIYSLITGELQGDTILNNNSHNAFVVQANVQFENFIFIYFNSDFDNLDYYGVITADTGSAVTLYKNYITSNTGRLDGTILSAYKDSKTNIISSNINQNSIETGALFTRNANAKISINKSIIGANGNGNGYSNIFYTKQNGMPVNLVNKELLLEVNETIIGGNKMGICSSFFGSINFNNCTVSLDKSPYYIFNIFGDSATFTMDSCSINNFPDSVSTFCSAYNLKRFDFSNSTIGYVRPSSYTMSTFFDIDAIDHVSFTNSQFYGLYATKPFDIYLPDSVILFKNCKFQGGGASSYYLHTYSKTLRCENSEFLGIGDTLGNYISADSVLFSKCNFIGSNGFSLTAFDYVKYAEVDSCTFKYIYNKDYLFTTAYQSELVFKNNLIEEVTLASPNIEKYLFANLGGKQTLTNNTIKAVTGHGNLFYNSGQTTLFGNYFYDLVTPKPVFLNYNNLSVYNSNFHIAFSPLFKNDSSLNKHVRFNLINDVIYTLNDTVVVNAIEQNNFSENISNCFSNKKSLMGNAVTIDTLINYADLYSNDAHPYITDQGFDLSDSSFVTAVDITGASRIQGNAIDIGAYETSGIITAINKYKTVAFKCYPNPSEDVTIAQVEESTVLEIFGMDGKKINSYKLEKGDNKIFVSNLEKGIYIFSLKTADGITSMLFMKQ